MRGRGKKAHPISEPSIPQRLMGHTTASVLTVSHREPVPAYATAAQKEEICKLLNHPTFSREEKAGVLRGTFHLTFSEAQSTIAVLNVARDAYDQGHRDPEGGGAGQALAA